MGRSAGVLQPLGVALAGPQSHPFLAHHRPPDPYGRLKAVGKRVDPVAGWTAHHSPAPAWLGPDGVGVVGEVPHGSSAGLSK